MDLQQKHCVPCDGSAPPLGAAGEQDLLARLKGWRLDRSGIHKLAKSFEFSGFRGAMAFAEKVAQIAEREGHHPDIHIYYRKVHVEVYTHAILGLSENDFIVAAKIDAVA
ncbi:MAG: 4a-hydroxytetrahydrobiopterin dehydratase [Chitinivibrionales bacterium]|nr:4a-hydroxytetrahydrobiopterin dehydratase [Chitinivibrionales bacterium]MBD3394674.1 4a-hydroxytetrahydrobiopterin dehydratase [Chitinivibrionales bacterium]